MALHADRAGALLQEAGLIHGEHALGIAEPVADQGALGPAAADDPMVVFNLTDQIRETIQQALYALLMQRRSIFF